MWHIAARQYAAINGIIFAKYIHFGWRKSAWPWPYRLSGQYCLAVLGHITQVIVANAAVVLWGV